MIIDDNGKIVVDIVDAINYLTIDELNEYTRLIIKIRDSFLKDQKDREEKEKRDANTSAYVW